MICLQCGYCCIASAVIVIHPDYAKPNFQMKITKEKMILFKNSNEICPHFEWIDNNTANCKIHHYKWYKRTPCYSHGQIEQSKTDECRMGRYIKDQNINLKDEYYYK